jgi:hypothetical protein
MESKSTITEWVGELHPLEQQTSIERRAAVIHPEAVCAGGWC